MIEHDDLISVSVTCLHASSGSLDEEVAQPSFA